MKPSTYTLMALNFVFWGYFVWSGLSQPSYNSEEQTEYYLYFPLLMLTVSLAFPIFLGWTRWSSVSLAASVISLLLLFPYVFYYTGGM
jgi:hypothetical protein